MKALILLVVAAGLGAFGYAVFPDVQRYLKMRSM
jgi:hypothetical protein